MPYVQGNTANDSPFQSQNGELRSPRRISGSFGQPPMEGKWANLPPELGVIKDRWLGTASCDDNMAPIKSPLKPPHGPLRETDQSMETLCLHLRRGDDGLETVSRISMSADSLECIGKDGDHCSVEAFPLSGGHAGDRRGRQGLNVDPCTQRAMTEKGRDSDSERRGGKCCDSEAGFSLVEPAPICGGSMLGRAKNERLQENFRPKVSSPSSPSQGAAQGVTTIVAKVSSQQGLERGVTSKLSREARQGDISVTTPALALVKPQAPGLRSDAELVHADLTTSSRRVQGHDTVPLKVSHCKAASPGPAHGPVPVPVPIRESLSPPAPATDNPPDGRRGNGSPRTHGSRSNGVSSRLRPPGWARATAPTIMIEQDQYAARSRKSSSPSGETTSSRQMTEVAEAIGIDRSDASCDTRNTVRATPALPSSRCVKVGRYDSSTQPVVMVVDYDHKGNSSTVSRHKPPAKSRRMRNGSAYDKHCWDLPSPLEDHRCHLAIAVDGRSRPTGSSYSSRSTERRYGGEAGGYRSCESSSYLEAMGRRERRSARFEAERRRAAMARVARKLKPSATIGDRAPWGKGRVTPAEAERRKLLQRKADYACELRKKAQEQAQVARLYLSKEKEIFDSSNVVPTEGGLSNDDTARVRVGGPFAGRARGVVPLPCEISPGSPVPHSKRLPRVSTVGKKAECGTGRCGGERDDDREHGHGTKQSQGLVEATGEEEQLIASIAHLDGLLHNGLRNHSPTPRADWSDKRPGGEGGERRILPASHNRVTNKPPRSRAVGKTRTRKGGGEGRGLSTLAATPNQGDDHRCVPVEALAADGHEPVVSAINDGMAQKAPMKFPPLFPRDRGGGDFVCHHRGHHEGRLRPQHITEGIELLHPLRRTPPPRQPPFDAGDYSICCEDRCHEQVHGHLQQGMRCLPPLDERHHECNSHRPLVFNTSRGVVENYQNDDRGCACNPR